MRQGLGPCDGVGSVDGGGHPIPNGLLQGGSVGGGASGHFRLGANDPPNDRPNG